MSGKRVIIGEGHRITGQQITWIGDCPWTGNLGFGCESGHFLTFPAETEHQTMMMLPSVLVAADSVNGVAFHDNRAIFTSRQSILLARQSRPRHIDLEAIWKRPYGAHGVVASDRGAFLLPGGPEGVLLLASPDVDSDSYEMRMAQRRGDPLYAYKLMRLGHADGAEVFAVASRNHGVMAFRYSGGWDVSRVVGHQFKGRDIVDVCSLNHPRFPLGVVAVSRNRDVFLIPDVLRLASVGALSYPELTGTAYGIHVSMGHLCMLTSRMLIILPDLITRFAQGDLPLTEQTASTTMTQASDIYPAGDEGIYVLETGVVSKYSLTALIGGIDESASKAYDDPQYFEVTTNEIQTSRFEPEWESSESELELVGAA